MQNSQGSIDLSFSRIERKRERERPSQRASKSHPRQCRVLTRVATWYELERGSEWIDKQLLSYNDRGLHFTRYRLSATGIGPCLGIGSKTGYFERCFLVNPSTSANKMSGRRHRRVTLMISRLIFNTK